MSRIGVFAISMALALAACGQPAEDKQASSDPAPTPEASVAAADKKPASYAQCAACHSTVKGQHGVGPSLAGVYGTKAGDIPGYAVSDALKKSGLIWDDATLDKWLESPMTMVPGTRMTYAGMPDPAKRKELVEYIKSLK